MKYADETDGAKECHSQVPKDQRPSQVERFSVFHKPLEPKDGREVEDGGKRKDVPMPPNETSRNGLPSISGAPFLGMKDQLNNVHCWYIGGGCVGHSLLKRCFQGS